MPPGIPAHVKHHRAYPRNGMEWAQAFREANICDTITGKCQPICSISDLTSDKQLGATTTRVTQLSWNRGNSEFYIP